MKPEYWDAIWLGLAVGFAPLVVGLVLLGLFYAGMYATFLAWEVGDWFGGAVGKLRHR